jgi:hypothetical protein
MEGKMIKLIKEIMQIIKEEKKSNAEIRKVHVRIIQLKEMELDKRQQIINNYRDLTLIDEMEIEQDILNIQKIILQKQKDMINFRSK